jgi:hypothetical protein
MIVKDQIEQLVIGKKLAATLKKGKKVFIAKDAAVARVTWLRYQWPRWRHWCSTMPS